MFGTEYGVLYLLLNFFIMLLGVITHFLKKKVRGETLADIKSYFKTHFRYTSVTIVMAIVGFIALVTTSGVGLIASFLAGYSADSAFNKAEGNAKINGTGNGK